MARQITWNDGLQPMQCMARKRIIQEYELMGEQCQLTAASEQMVKPRARHYKRETRGNSNHMSDQEMGSARKESFNIRM